MNLFYRISEYFNNSKYTNNHFNGTKTDYTKFIVLTYRRSGANYFLDLLRSHPEIVSFAGLYEKGKLGFSYAGYPKIECKSTLKFRDKYPVEFLNNRIFRTYSENIKAVGFKIIYEVYNKTILNHLRKMDDLKIINLQRRNLLRVHLSDQIVKVTNKWHVISKEHENIIKVIGAESRIKIIEDSKTPTLPDNFTIKLKYEECLNEFVKISNYIKEFKTFFNTDKFYIIYYEDLLNHYNKEIENIFNFLDVNNYELKSRFIKINNKKLSEIISNYFELKKQFIGTEWEVFFED